MQSHNFDNQAIHSTSSPEAEMAVGDNGAAAIYGQSSVGLDASWLAPYEENGFETMVDPFFMTQESWPWSFGFEGVSNDEGVLWEQLYSCMAVSFGQIVCAFDLFRKGKLPILEYSNQVMC